MSAAARLDDALDRALRHVVDVMEEPYAPEVRLSVDDDEAFWAVAEPDGDGLHLTISTGVVSGLDDLWSAAFQDDGLLVIDGRRITDDIAFMTQVSLVFLLLHEMAHSDLDHFGFTGGGITEAGTSRARGLLSRTPQAAAPVDELGHGNRSAAERCLELQADHEAIEFLLEGYSNEQWDVLRVRSAAVMAVMVLIEREDEASGSDGATHPSAATRIFQLLGHLASLWSVPAQTKAQELGLSEVREEDLPSDAESEAYQSEVIIPAFADAAALARAAKADSVARELGDPADFFADIGTVQEGTAETEADLRTAGAKELLALMPLNAAIMAMMGERGLSL
ncbi:hypothetical protein [Afifella marina]|uniref:Peptidase U49 n=1 Tax=Afifella marina DSM 2698 TaxID=1120955 RepID=A0A1G5N9R4_AFIMA|nr:hypothetical protein [Afifella marina]MBK1623113.1 hypothetical protein [Afifella marina DSM 2698]MBK1626107.1 hypothetical protein [Afifella marina]MBK5916985.1 hypothetical protein [Afifella marina]RAI21987.1 hypothetical protein CH311_04505 [Afifella marina DSM 2698]SCZ34143.1 hypothetical protein SAMN03080610_01644 [Afifella marina DSM 2698]